MVIRVSVLFARLPRWLTLIVDGDVEAVVGALGPSVRGLAEEGSSPLSGGEGHRGVNDPVGPLIGIGRPRTYLRDPVHPVSA